MQPRVSMVAALGEGRELGLHNQLLWQIPEDLKHFKALTVGHPVIMGRTTFESLPPKFRPLPGRTNIVVTRDSAWAHEGTLVAYSIDEALAKAASLDTKEVFIIGGASIYAQALPRASRLYLTIIHDTKAADAYFPPYDAFTKVVEREAHEQDGLRFEFVTLEK